MLKQAFFYDKHQYQDYELMRVMDSALGIPYMDYGENPSLHNYKW
jgi:hypothetical protein